jgi:hypothetical protein
VVGFNEHNWPKSMKICRRYPLPEPDFHRLDRASFAWRTQTDSERGGTDAGHRAGLLPDLAAVLAQDHIPNIMVLILNSPMRADGAGEGFGITASEGLSQCPRLENSF